MITARIFRVTIDRISFGMGPTLWEKERARGGPFGTKAVYLCLLCARGSLGRFRDGPKALRDLCGVAAEGLANEDG